MRQKRVALRVLSFALPVVLMLVVFAQLGVYPFGGRSLLVVDMDSEYIDYFVQMNKIAHEHGSFLRSWDMGMGLNMLGLIAFYVASPLNIIILLFPVSMITEAVLVVTLLKFGLCGLLFSLFCSYCFQRHGLLNVMASVAWAMIGYNISYSSNVMWLDGVAFLPLVLMGVEKMLREDKHLLLVLSLVYVFVASYYIGYMVGVFAFLYFTARWFSERGEPVAYLRKLGRFVLSAAMAAGCCAVLLLPAFLNLRSGQNSMFEIPDTFALDTPMVLMAAKLLPGVYDTLMDAGLPNIYASLAGLLGCVLYFLNGKVPLREKCVWGGLGALLVLSFSSRFLYLGWHAFEDPTWFPARFSFVFSFLMIYLALRGVALYPAPNWKRVVGAVLIPAVLFVEVAVNGLKFVTLSHVLLALFLLAAYGGILVAVQAGPQRLREPLAVLALFLLCAELQYNAAGVVAGVDEQFGYTDRQTYFDYRETYLPGVQRVEESVSGVYRIEVLEQRNANGGMALGYNGISHYSTTTDQSLNGLLKRLGYNTGLINELRFAQSTPLTNGLLGIRYVIARGEMGAGYDLIDTLEGGVGVYENTAAFPLVYWAPGDVLRVDAEHEDPFELQNEIVRAMGGEALFTPLEIVQERLDNVAKSTDNHILYTRRAQAEEAVIEYVIKNPGGGEAFAFMPMHRGYARAEIYVDDVHWGSDMAYRHNTVIALGSEETVTLRVVLNSERAHIRDVYVYALDLADAQAAAQAAQGMALDFDVFEDTRVAGTVWAPDDGVLVTSFPFDEGWRVEVDGARVVPQRYLDAFLAVALPAGEHAVRMRYWPPGFLPGLAVTVASVAGLTLWWALHRRGVGLPGRGAKKRA